MAAELPDGRIGVLFEREGYSEIQGTSSPSVQVRLPQGVAAAGVTLAHPGGATIPVDLPPGGRAVFGAPYPSLTVTEADVGAGRAEARFAVPSLGPERTLRFSTEAGALLP